MVDKAWGQESISWQDESFHLICKQGIAVPFEYYPSCDRLKFSFYFGEDDPIDLSIDHFIRQYDADPALNQKNAALFKLIVRDALSSGKGGQFESNAGLPTAYAHMPGFDLDAEKLSIFSRIRWRRIFYACVKGDDGKVDHLAGIAIDIQSVKDNATTLAESLVDNATFIQSMTANASLAMQFDQSTGTRIITEGDVVPPTVPSDVTLPQMFLMLTSHAKAYDGRASFEVDDEMLASEYFNGGAPRTISFDCQMTSFGDTFEGTRWFGVTYRFSRSPKNSHTSILIYIIDIHDKKTAELALIRQTMKDPLTGLLNRASFEECCSRLSQAAQRSSGKLAIKSPCACVLVEIDSFAEINEAYGLPLGDKVLKKTATTLRAIAHDRDLISHFSGAHFAVLVRDIESTAILQEHIRVLRAALVNRIDERNTLTASIGVAVCPEDGQIFEELYEKADIALHKAHESGGNTYVFYTPDLEDADTLRPVIPLPAAALPERAKIQIVTFGFFDVFIDGEPVVFHSAKAKELLALLVDRKGGFVSSKEAISYLWEDEPADKVTMARYRKIAMRLKNSLDASGIGDIIENMNGARRIVPENVDCDLFNYLSGKPGYANLFNGSYMNNYSWGENAIPFLKHARNS